MMSRAINFKQKPVVTTRDNTTTKHTAKHATMTTVLRREQRRHWPVAAKDQQRKINRFINYAYLSLRRLF